MKPFQERLEALLKKLAKRKEVRLGEIINILPEIKSSKKKLIKVSDLLNQLGCQITADGLVDADAGDLDSVEFNAKEAKAAEKEIEAELKATARAEESAVKALDDPIRMYFSQMAATMWWHHPGPVSCR
ncbi:MAG: hypothetical protein DSY92_07595 [Planctomycetota bacterium]|nr:MAG: hypothetical protein DSY92_07595 [Planctomycetota bacterium]